MKTKMAIGLGLVALVLAGCTTTPRQGPVRIQEARAPMPPITALPPSIAQPEPTTPTPPVQQARLNPGQYGFIDSTALPLLNPQARSAATDAQFYALQFGRPGAPRAWNAGGSSGQVSVGPYVRVNNLDCREFTHTVRRGGQEYVRRGTACREQTGNWTVERGA